jgi:hypothetical protein
LSCWDNISSICGTINYETACRTNSLFNRFRYPFISSCPNSSRIRKSSKTRQKRERARHVAGAPGEEKSMSKFIETSQNSKIAMSAA